MAHALEEKYGLTSKELLDALKKRFRALVALEGVVAEAQLLKWVQRLVEEGSLADFEEHDLDGHPDFSLLLPNGKKLLMECKNVRYSKATAHKDATASNFWVETQKTRASTADKTSRFYDRGYFDILAVCLGKKTRNWTNFMFIATKNLAPHRLYPGKLAVMHPVPLFNAKNAAPWSKDLTVVLKELA